MSFLDQLQKRRTIYNIGRQVSFADAELESLIKNAVRQSPSAFNSQSSRVVILFNQSHEKFWTLVLEALQKLVPADAFAATQQRIQGFIDGYGTVLFYEDQDVVKQLQQNFAQYAENFPVWSEHSTAIAQFAVWLALEDQGLGASLQHYNPIVDEAAAEAFGIPAQWKLRAQLVFGSVEAPAAEKTYIDDAVRFKTFN
ncbi:nitroreductase family protein [Acinetobacter larvae]|uniref:Nitroreductase n=1 Tax=Acinetobacter larvae TaxID=1789224 RepID=A0A1B2M093_9GAMM|nr:nitroreductase family protein [Acinetobacter larvae]AOA58624.1 nitroreductase [Acinetobacter larvae]